MKNFNIKMFSFLFSLFTAFVVYGKPSESSLNKIPFLTTVAIVDQTMEEALAEAKVTVVEAITDHCGPTSGILAKFKILRTHLMSEIPELSFDYITIEGEYECFLTRTPE